MATTWNPSDKNASVALSNGNLTAGTVSGNDVAVRGTVSFASGRRVFRVTGITELGHICLGVANSSATLADYIGTDSNSFGITHNDFHTGEDVWIAIDGPNFYSKIAANAWSGNPDAGTGGDAHGITGALFPAVSFGPGESATIDGAATGHGLTTFTPWDGTGAQTLTPSLFTNSNSFFAPTVTRGAVSLTPSLFQNTNSFFSPTVTQAGGSQTLTPSLFSNTNSFFAHAVTRGAITLTPALFTNSATFFSPTVTRGAVTLTPSQFSNTNSFFAHTVTRGAVTLTPSLFSNSNTFFSPTVSLSGGTQTLSPALFQNANSFFSPTLSRGAVTLLPGLFQNVATFYPPTVFRPGAAQFLSPGFFQNRSVIFLPAVSNDNAPGTYPLAIQGDPTTVTGRLTGGGSVVAGAIPSTARVIASSLKGRA